MIQKGGFAFRERDESEVWDCRVISHRDGAEPARWDGDAVIVFQPAKASNNSADRSLR
jgi:hypothetical protein